MTTMKAEILVKYSLFVSEITEQFSEAVLYIFLQMGMIQHAYTHLYFIVRLNIQFFMNNGNDNCMWVREKE